jgi:glutamyl-tRNA reductase
MGLTGSVAAFRVCAWRTVSFRAAEMAAVRASVDAAHRDDAVVTSCQRLEAFGFGDCDCEAPTRYRGIDALKRLAVVAAGLDSVVLGEDQITGQVRAAFAGTSNELRRLADIAISSARALRNETRFDSHVGHLLDRALRLAGVPPVGGTLLVLGAGAMGRLIAARGQELGFDVVVAARRPPSGECPWRFVDLGSVIELRQVDVLCGCLGSGAGEIALRMLPRARLVVDLGTPRNFIEPEGPGLVTIAGLLESEERRPHAMARRAELRERLDVILGERLANATADGSSAIGRMRMEVEAIRQREVERIQRLHPGIAPELVDTITRSLIDRVFHAATARLRESGDLRLAEAVAGLFAEQADQPAATG